MPINGWVRGMSVDLVDAQGREVPQRVLHHLNVIMPERRELFSQIMLRIGAAGPETKPWELPFFLGYRIHPGDSVLFTAMVHNPTPNPPERGAHPGQARLHPRRHRPAAAGHPPGSTWDLTPPRRVGAFDLHPTSSSAQRRRPPRRCRGSCAARLGGRLHRVRRGRIELHGRCHGERGALGGTPRARFGSGCRGDADEVLPAAGPQAGPGPRLPPDRLLRQPHRTDHPRRRHGRAGGASFCRAWGRPGRHRPTTIRSIARTSA